MKMSQLAEESGESIATVKYYRREGLLHPGEAISTTRAEYDHSHVERLRLIRALTDVAGLDLTQVRGVLAAIGDPAMSKIDLMATAQQALRGPRVEAAAEDVARARAWLDAREWQVDPDEANLLRLARCLRACEDAEVAVGSERLGAYADAMEEVARLDLASVPNDPAGAARQVVLGTALVDPLLIELRRLAQQHVAVSEARAPARCPAAGSAAGAEGGADHGPEQ